MEVRNIKLTVAPNTLMTIPTITEERNSRCSKEKFSFSAKI
jgi:hypothetical protein